jgi:hypothetical protein
MAIIIALVALGVATLALLLAKGEASAQRRVQARVGQRCSRLGRRPPRPVVCTPRES